MSLILPPSTWAAGAATGATTGAGAATGAAATGTGAGAAATTGAGAATGAATGAGATRAAGAATTGRRGAGAAAGMLRGMAAGTAPPAIKALSTRSWVSRNWRMVAKYSAITDDISSPWIAVGSDMTSLSLCRVAAGAALWGRVAGLRLSGTTTGCDSVMELETGSTSPCSTPICRGASLARRAPLPLSSQACLGRLASRHSPSRRPLALA